MSSSTVRTARRRTLRIAAAALTAAAGLTLTACSGSDTGGSKAAAHLDTEAAAADTSSGAGASADGQESGGQAGTGAKAESGAKAKAEGKTGAPGAAGEKSARSGAGGGSKAGGSGGQRCHTSDLKAAFATGEDAVPDPNASGGTTTSIVLTNKSSRTCTIGGFAGVDLRPDAGGPSWSLARSSAKHGSITLGPGDSTDFTLNLGMAKENDEGSWKPATVAVTPPNETTALTLKWPWGPLVHQDGATHPATFVNPIG
ncbi:MULTISPECIES: DUF4232 domain-containing protein [Streptomyces]|uniref:DUF4232 domain-containing protein n=2 Tax=Streptomyces rimosus subsp. rimosus TaxID=132474 RepID=L8EMP9_STRR1|nr:DUF4232 domain-containing protein [Streptomyces rimosus]MYT44528.1 DUF4232 domain-containing protein [Streptomyces sp. SID5471]KEF02268.1 flagellar motor protein MotB [Streptomyces rimosus]KOT28128.1 flagellar motor protein MotB [Streptomyces rimosus subsp. rimosus]QDA04963.1 DUF4232 domain-containing protein [Streptomyces rimosus]QEV76242.1 DUF4232 domain-containing protein [Streptomyces rimosus]